MELEGGVRLKITKNLDYDVLDSYNGEVIASTYNPNITPSALQGLLSPASGGMTKLHWRKERGRTKKCVWLRLRSPSVLTQLHFSSKFPLPLDYSVYGGLEGEGEREGEGRKMEVLMGSSLDEGGEGKLRFFKKKRGGDYRNNDNNMNISNDNDNDNDNMNDIDLNNNNKNNIQKGKEGGERRRRRGGGGRGGGERLLIPVLYVKVILLSRGEDKVGEGGGAMRLDPASWTFFIKVDGDNSDFVQTEVVKKFEEERQKKATKLLLKHLRDQQLWEPYNSLSNLTNTQLEHPLLSSLHASIQNGDFSSAKKIVMGEGGEGEGVFGEYAGVMECRPEWEMVKQDGVWPRKRGGHQMEIDSEGRQIWLFGGWDGRKDLGDLWVFDIEKTEWECVSQNTQQQGGPSPRSCHKMCINTEHKKLYILGQYIDGSTNGEENGRKNDFYCFDIQKHYWTKLSESTEDDGGPALIFDHQLAMDHTNNHLYVFGGKIISQQSSERFSGLFRYKLNSQTWEKLRGDGESSEYDEIPLSGRVGHSMILDETTGELYFFAGERKKDKMKVHFNDICTYNIASDSIHLKTSSCTLEGGVEQGFTSRATMNEKKGEIYMSGIMRNGKGGLEHSSFWMYSIVQDKWIRIDYNGQKASNNIYWEKMERIHPRPRFAHQLVYDYVDDAHYIFGGNPGFETADRLNDLWKMVIKRPTEHEIIQRCLIMIKRQEITEMCLKGDVATAMKKVQEDNGKNELDDFSAWFTHLIMQRVNLTKGGEIEKKVEEDRKELFVQLDSFFPRSFCEPPSSLVDHL